ncbi:MAG: ScpA family protein [Thermomicrobiales bacterium]
MQLQASRAMPSLDGYQLRLAVFEGPLDVLLRLIEREQLPIAEISLLAVCDQFLAYTRAMESAPPEIIAEFAVIAGRLSLLKSRSLLPRPVQPPDDSEAPDLVRQLEEYRAVKTAATLLAERQQAGLGAYGRGEGVATPPTTTQPLAPQPPTVLARAVRRWLSRATPPPAPLPTRVAVTLREMIGRLLSALDRDAQVPFATLRAGCHSRQDVAVAFLAVLTLLRRQRISVSQTDLFGPITIFRAESPAIRGDFAVDNHDVRSDQQDGDGLFA